MTEEASQDTTSEAPLRFQSGGAVRPGAFYIERDADTELLKTLLAGEYCYVLAPRQMGKSSLRVRAGQKLREHGVRHATIDLQRIGSGKDIKINDWYYSVIDMLNSSLGLNRDLTAFWMEQGQHLTDPNAIGRSTLAHSWSTFLEREVLAHSTEPIVIFVDEIDSVLSLPFSTDDFFAAIRSAHESRPEHPQYNRLTFCLMGVAAPNDLIRDTTRTPFNIGRSISLEDFTWPQTQNFLGGFSNVSGNGAEYLKFVFSWANGQPYMTHKLCQEIVKLDGQSSGQSEAETVRKLVETIFLQRGRTQDSNLRYAEDRFDQISSPATKSQLLQLYRSLLHGQQVEVTNDNPAQSELKLTGLAAERHDARGAILQQRNKIFATVFDEKWIREKEGERLLQEALAKWLEARRHNETGEEYLLRGKALEEGLAWSSQREDVTKEERQFLFASQELARKKALAEARWAKRLKTLSGLLIGALIIAIALAAIAFKQNSAVVASRSELEKQKHALETQAKELQRNQVILSDKNTALKVETERAITAENKASEKAAELAKTAEELRTANSDLSRAREESAAILNASRRQLYFSIGNRELKEFNIIPSSVYFATSHDLIDSNHPDRMDSLIRAKVAMTAQFVTPLIGKEKDLISASLSPDGTHLLSLNKKSTVALWDAQSGMIIKDKAIDGEWVPENPWRPDSQSFVTSLKGDYKLWITKTGKLRHVLPGTGGSALYWSNDSKRVISLNNAMTLWNAESGELVAKLIEKDASPYTQVAWSRDSKQVAIVDEKGIVQLWDSYKGKKINPLAVNFNVDPFDEVEDSSLTGGRGIFITYTQEGLKLWDADNGLLRKQLSDSHGISKVVLSADSERIIALDYGTIRQWNAQNGSAMTAIPGEFRIFHTLGRGDSLRIITVGLRSESKLWNGKTGECMVDLPAKLPRNDSELLDNFLVLGHSERFALGIKEGVQLWDSKTGQLLHTLPATLSGVKALTWSDDEKRVIIQNNPMIAEDKYMPARIWDVQTGKPLAMLPIISNFNNLSQVSWPGERFITNQFDDGPVQIWKLRFTPPLLPELIRNVQQNSGCKLVDEEVKCDSDETPNP